MGQVVNLRPIVNRPAGITRNAAGTPAPFATANVGQVGNRRCPYRRNPLTICACRDRPGDFIGHLLIFEALVPAMRIDIGYQARID